MVSGLPILANLILANPFFCVVVVGFGVGKYSQLFVFASLLCVCCVCVCGGCVQGLSAGPPSAGPPSAGPPRRTAPPDRPPPDRPKFRSFFSLSRHSFHSFSLSCWSFSLNFGGVFEDRDAQMCTFGVLGLSCETPAAPPDRAAGARTRQPENSKRAHLSAPALQTPPKFHEKDQKRGRKE